MFLLVNYILRTNHEQASFLKDMWQQNGQKNVVVLISIYPYWLLHFAGVYKTATNKLLTCEIKEFQLLVCL